MVEMLETWVNDRWPLLLPKHRHDRPEWPWWEAGRLASMWHHLGRPVDPTTMTVEEYARREVVYDIGSEEGDFPALFSSWGCDVVLFEPNDRVWPNINAIWAANELRPPLLMVPGFASAEPNLPDGKLVVHWPSAEDVAKMPADETIISDHGFCNLSERPDIQAIPIDFIVAEGLAPPPTAITIDVEGAEWLVLVGAKNVMKEHRPKIWVSVHQQFAREMYGDTDVLRSISLMMQERDYDRGTFIAYDHEAHWLWLPVEHPDAVAW